MYKATQKQINLLNRRVRVWHTSTATDSYTIAIRYQRNGKIVWDVYGMNHEPNGPQGFNQYSHTHDGNSYRVYENHLTKRVKWSQCPLVVINAILARV